MKELHEAAVFFAERVLAALNGSSPADPLYADMTLREDIRQLQDTVTAMSALRWATEHGENNET